jgi:hypothetical protein
MEPIATVRAEDIMTPRNLLRYGRDDADAERLADSNGFDAVPIITADGKLSNFWSRPDRRRIRIRARHRLQHDAPVERLLLPLGEHVVQFVHYRSEVVGLVDASDLNRPSARIAWLYPMLQLERALLDRIRELHVSDDAQAKALGERAMEVLRRQRKAKRAELELPLLEYAMFPELLKAARKLGLVVLDDTSIEALNQVRKRAAHSGDVVVESRADCQRLVQVLATARSTTQAIGRVRP